MLLSCGVDDVQFALVTRNRSALLDFVPTLRCAPHCSRIFVAFLGIASKFGELVMPYRILLKTAHRVLSCKRRGKQQGISQIITDNTDRVEVRNGKGLLLFYRPQLSAVKI